MRFDGFPIKNREMATNIEVIIGTYEQFLLGYKVEQVNCVNAFLRNSIESKID